MRQTLSQYRDDSVIRPTTASDSVGEIGHGNILIVEDQGLVRAGMKALIEMAYPQYRVEEECSYEGALEKLNHASFDFIFLDIDLGGGHSGIDILSFLQEQKFSCRKIMLSGKEDREVVLDCIALGASGYITKGTGDSQVFKQAIATVLEGMVYLPSFMVGTTGISTKNAGSIETTPSDLGISPRQSEVLYFLCQGLTNKAIANRMLISEGTVRKSYVSELLRLFGVTRRTELMIEVSRRRLQIPAPAP